MAASMGDKHCESWAVAPKLNGVLMLQCSVLSQVQLYPPLWGTQVSTEQALWGFIAFFQAGVGLSWEHSLMCAEKAAATYSFHCFQKSSCSRMPPLLRNSRKGMML